MLALAISLMVAATPAPDRTISVSGEAQVNVVPDEVTITLGVESRDPELAKAVADNDARVKAVLASAKANGVDEKHLQTEALSIEPRWEDYSGKRKFDAYYVHKNLCIVLRDLPKFERVLSGALQAGANEVQGVQFSTTKLREHRDEARTQAIRAAKEKAVALAKELGAKVGPPRTITEGGMGWYSSYGNYGANRYGAQTQNVVQSSGAAAAEVGETNAAGTVAVTANVSVVFDLE